MPSDAASCAAAPRSVTREKRLTASREATAAATAPPRRTPRRETCPSENGISVCRPLDLVVRPERRTMATSSAPRIDFRCGGDKPVLRQPKAPYPGEIGKGTENVSNGHVDECHPISRQLQGVPRPGNDLRGQTPWAQNCATTARSARPACCRGPSGS